MCIYEWDIEDEAFMKELIKPAVKNREDIIDYMVSRHGNTFIECLENETLNKDYSKHPTQVLMKHSIPNLLIQQINEYNANHGTNFGYNCGSLFALKQVINKNGEAEYVEEFELCKTTDGIDILKFIKSIDSDVPVIMISGHANIKIAVDSIKLGAFEFLEKPFNKDRLLNFVNRAIETSLLKKENKLLKKNLYFSNELIGNSSKILKLKSAIERFSKTDSRILIYGPAGSGKELVSRIVHDTSSRAKNQFKIVNGAILDPPHFEVELFGSENKDKIISGIFEKANNGTLLIDNVSDIPLETQGKILRVLSDQKFHRVNSANEINVNIRFICSTSKNLNEDSITDNLLTRDLYSKKLQSGELDEQEIEIEKKR